MDIEESNSVPMKSLLERYKLSQTKPTRPKASPPHEKAASVDAIIKVVGENKTYNYTYWLHKVGNASFSDVLDILKEASSLEKKYSKGGYITNKLKPYAVSKINTKSTRGVGRGSIPLSKSKQ